MEVNTSNLILKPLRKLFVPKTGAIGRALPWSFLYWVFGFEVTSFFAKNRRLPREEFQRWRKSFLNAGFLVDRPAEERKSMKLGHNTERSTPSIA